MLRRARLSLKPSRPLNSYRRSAAQFPAFSRRRGASAPLPRPVTRCLRRPDPPSSLRDSGTHPASYSERSRIAWDSIGSPRPRAHARMEHRHNTTTSRAPSEACPGPLWLDGVRGHAAHRLGLGWRVGAGHAAVRGCRAYPRPCRRSTEPLRACSPLILQDPSMLLAAAAASDASGSTASRSPPRGAFGTLRVTPRTHRIVAAHPYAIRRSPASLPAHAMDPWTPELAALGFPRVLAYTRRIPA